MAAISVDPSYEDKKSTDSDSSLVDTTSIASDIASFRQENGRTYHAYHEGQYWGPNDKQQNDALEVAHHVMLVALDNRLTLAPLKLGAHKILDVGTGTGLWAIDMAEQYPRAKIIGTDLSPIQPSWVPSNVTFEIDDCCMEWTYKPNSFDFIHVSMLLGSIADWPAFYRQVMRTLKLGAHFEQREMGIHFLSDDDTVGKESPLGRWGPLFALASRKAGRELNMIPLLESNIRAAGFRNVKVTRMKLPVGGWAEDPKLKAIGILQLEHCVQSAEGWAMALLTRVMGWSMQEVKIYVEQVQNQLKDTKVHSYVEMLVVNAKHP